MVEILVFSYDGANDIWPVFFNNFFASWPDCPYKINLLTNHLKYGDSRVVSIQTGNDLDWSSNAIKAIQTIKSEYILTLFDDFIFDQKILSSEIHKFAEIVEKEAYDIFRLRPSPLPDYKVNNDYGRLDLSAIYRVSLTCTIIKKSTLLNLIKPGENAWDFEHNGTLRSKSIYHCYGTYKSYLPYINSLEKGKWTPWAVEFFERHPDQKPNYEKRGFCQFKWSDRNWLARNIKLFFLYRVLGPKMRSFVFYHWQKMKGEKAFL